MQFDVMSAHGARDGRLLNAPLEVPYFSIKSLHLWWKNARRARKPHPQTPSGRKMVMTINVQAFAQISSCAGTALAMPKNNNRLGQTL